MPAFFVQYIAFLRFIWYNTKVMKKNFRIPKGAGKSK